MKTLFLAWQAPQSRAWFPIGRLMADVTNASYIFEYTRGALAAQESGFHPVVSFPELTKRYQSEQLFPMFRNRVLGEGRKDFSAYLQSLALDSNDPIEILAITGGERQTDNFEVFPKIEKTADHSFSCRFFLHGLRYMPAPSKERALRLESGERLGVSLEMTNPHSGLAIQLSSRDYHFLGWAPRYLVADLLHSFSSIDQLHATVIQVNHSDVPANRRVLIELAGRLPKDLNPMASEQFLPISNTAAVLREAALHG